MRYACHVFNAFNCDVETGKRAHCCVAAEADTFNKYVCLGKTVLLLGSLAGFFTGYLGGVSRTLLGTAETAAAGAGAGQRTALGIGKSNDGVVKRSQDVHLAGG